MEKIDDIKFNLMLKEKDFETYVPSEVKKATNNRIDCGSLGRELYIYYGIDTISKIANETNELWFKSAKFYFDKEENCNIGNKYFYIFLYLDKKNYTNKFKNIVEKSFKTYSKEKYLKRYYILCTSYKPDNALCWSTFFDNSINATEINIKKNKDMKINSLDDSVNVKGDFSFTYRKKQTTSGCISFNKDNLRILVSKKFIIHGYVNYSLEQMTNIFFNCLDEIYLLYKNGITENDIIYYIYQLIDYFNLFTKSDFYGEEKEYRFVLDTSFFDLIENKDSIAYDSTNDVYKLKFPKDIISHITITNSKDKEKFKGFNIRLSKISFNEEGIKYGFAYES